MHITATAGRISNLVLEVAEYEMQGHQTSPRTASHVPCVELVNIPSNISIPGLPFDCLAALVMPVCWRLKHPLRLIIRWALRSSIWIPAPDLDSRVRSTVGGRS